MTKFHYYVIVTLLSIILVQIDFSNLKFLWLGVGLAHFLLGIIFIYKNME
jgi:hypothetical protein